MLRTFLPLVFGLKKNKLVAKPVYESFTMRRREKFVLSSILLSLGLLSVQYISLDWRYVGVIIFTIVSYFVSAWALSDDLQRFEWLTILPLPALYAGAVGAFYFLLPVNLLSRFFNLVLFGVGMYALYLTSNIYSVAKGRTIQLLHAAHAIGLLFTLLTSLLFLNTIFSQRLPFYLNAPLVGLLHFPLIFLFLWSVNLQPKIDRQLVNLSLLLTLFLTELAIIFSLYPFSVWNIALFIMTFLYIGLGVLQSHLQDRLFQSTLTEYSWVGAFILVIFVLLFPLK